jgi:hypothetical protein
LKKNWLYREPGKRPKLLAGQDKIRLGIDQMLRFSETGEQGGKFP